MDTKVFMPNRPMFDSGSIQGVKKAQTHTHTHTHKNRESLQRTEEVWHTMVVASYMMNPQCHHLLQTGFACSPFYTAITHLRLV